MTPRMFRRYGSGDKEFVLVLTQDDWAGPNGNEMPQKKCHKCDVTRYPIAFLNRGELQADGYLHLVDGNVCMMCEPTVGVSLHFGKDGKLRMRIGRFCDARGQPYQLWDEKRAAWVPLQERGLRKMGERAEVRLQPYLDRRVDHEGRRYR